MLYIPPTPPPTRKVYTSVSDGSISVLNLDNGTSLSPLWERKAHDYEAWCIAGDGEHRVYSGGDDGMFYGWDLRSSENTFRNKRYRYFFDLSRFEKSTGFDTPKNLQFYN